MIRRYWAAISLLLALVAAGCSDNRFVADTIAQHHWHAARYEHDCTVATKQKQQFGKDLNELKRQEDVASEIVTGSYLPKEFQGQVKGKLPPEARKSLRAQKKKVRDGKC